MLDSGLKTLGTLRVISVKCLICARSGGTSVRTITSIAHGLLLMWPAS